jgi:hypothetical protein
MAGQVLRVNVGKCVAVRVKGTVARGTVTGTAGACKVSQLFVSVRCVAVESRQVNPSKLIAAMATLEPEPTQHNSLDRLQIRK